MASVKYTFVKSVIPSKLEREIRESPIITALDFIATSGLSCDIYFKVALSAEDEATLGTVVTNHVAIADPATVPPTDSEGSPLVRSKATKTGWFYQVHSLEIATATIGGVHNRRVHHLTGVEEETGFATVKHFDSNLNLLTTEEDMIHCCQTQVDWSPSHDMEIRGGTVSQGARPAGDCRLYVCIAPGLVSSFFIQGGMNLRHMQIGNYAVDGETAKFLPAPTSPGGMMYGLKVNLFRIFLIHDPGLKHNVQLTMQFYKP